jgi:hypothetical protein
MSEAVLGGAAVRVWLDPCLRSRRRSWLSGVFVPLFDATSSDQAEGTVTASYSISLWVLI